MRKLVLLLAALLSVTVTTGCTRIEPGYVGIKVNMYGDQKGVDDFPIQTGRVWYNPFTEDIYEYPTFIQNAAWTDDDEGEEGVNQAITFNSIEGAQITANVGLNYSLDPEKVPAMFVEFRKDIDYVTATYLRNKVRDAFNRVGAKYKAVEIFGEKKSALLDEVKPLLEAQLAGKGFIIDTVSFISSPTAPPDVMESVAQVIKATQKAIEAENKVRQVEAEAKQKVAEAQGEAESILKVAEAQAEANRKLAESVTPALIQYQMMERWDGVAPRVLGGDSGFMLTMPVSDTTQ